MEDWTVEDAYGQTRTFVDKGPACAYAVRNARADKATVVVAPNGERTLVLRIDPQVEVVTLRRLAGGGTTA
ncbi:hypothetical protein [Micromonospora sp. NPDC004551]|uniref:hypothetical protein n=1 Tax=Micromonospora sp. NPDC004551 TaxID=3154284 RepID=UPI0033BB6E58